MKIIAIYDNGGKSLDRYTIYFDTKFDVAGKLNDCLAVSDNCNSPLGFSQFAGGQLGPHNGVKIPFRKLPEHVQKHVRCRLED